MITLLSNDNAEDTYIATANKVVLFLGMSDIMVSYIDHRGVYIGEEFSEDGRGKH